MIKFVINNLSHRDYTGHGVFVVPSFGREGRQFINSMSTKVDLNKVHRSGGGEKESSMKDEESSIKYNKLFNEELYIKAYNESKSKPGNMTPGIDGETIDGISKNWVRKVIESLKDRSFQFKPSRRIEIPKPNGKTRPLGIPSPRDKIIQKVILNLLEKIFEKEFLDTSHGFRPNKSCHTAIRKVKQWTGTTWMIEGDIKGYFDNINHHKLAELLTKRIKDKNIIDLYWKLVNAGYIQTSTNQVIKSNIGVPQGGILSPLLSNIYLNELDNYMEELKKTYTTEGRMSKQTKEYNKILTPYRKAVKEYRENKTTENLKKLKEVNKLRLNTKYSVRVGTKIHYVRYADDFLIGVLGPKSLAIEIKNKVYEFLKKELLIELNLEKTKITHCPTNHVKFLGFYLKPTSKKNTNSLRIEVKTNNDQNTIIGNAPIGMIKTYIPKDLIINRLREKGFVQPNEMKSKYYGPWIALPKEDIIRNYRYIIMGYCNYYRICDNYYQIETIKYLLKYSAAHTLAAKERSSLAKVFNKYGKNLNMLTPKGSIINLDYTPNINTKTINDVTDNYYQNKDPLHICDHLARTIYHWDQPCKLCGETKNIEMHHVRHLRDLNPKLSNVDAIMATLKRKQIPLCTSCHDKVHLGKSYLSEEKL